MKGKQGSKPVLREKQHASRKREHRVSNYISNNWSTTWGHLKRVTIRKWNRGKKQKTQDDRKTAQQAASKTTISNWTTIRQLWTVSDREKKKKEDGHAAC